MTAPSYSDHVNADARAHVLGAITSAYAAADELAAGHQRSALIELDRVIALAHEARKFVLSSPPAPEGHRQP